MNSTISNNGMPKFTPTKGSGTAKGTATAASTAAGSGSPASKAGDQLKLTDSARALQHATQASDASPIDPQRVESVRQSLADGSYKINPGHIADRLIAMDHQIGGKS
ncbi:MAG: flagellar biosynthesis anti-sigma factor FlgM [Rhodanobacter sp.]|nr:flagellar biosynthesis anti-sigma factor FlgM [Rhodanobacter sp.]